VPFPEYTAAYHAATGRSGEVGGLEHARSATMVFGAGYPLDDDHLRGRAATLVFHEVFHAWNVKALRPAMFSPYRYDREPRCRTLWFAEGFTNYYGALLPVRCGYWAKDDLLRDEIADTYAAYARSSGRRATSLMRASEITFDSAVFGEGEGTSYYDKGMLVALVLDLQIRARTEGERSLDDVMRWLYDRYGAPKGGYPEEFLPAAIRRAAGLDMERECRRYLETADDLPVADALALVGLRLSETRGRWRVADDPSAPAAARRRRDGWLKGDGGAARWGGLFRMAGRGG
jgi:predicted metalloprotease with PDZ domain